MSGCPPPVFLHDNNTIGVLVAVPTCTCSKSFCDIPRHPLVAVPRCLYLSIADFFSSCAVVALSPQRAVPTRPWVYRAQTLLSSTCSLPSLNTRLLQQPEVTNHVPEAAQAAQGRSGSYSPPSSDDMLTCNQSAMKEKNSAQPKKPQPQFTPVAREESPLFEPEGPLEQQSPQVPVAVMVAPVSTPAPAPVSELDTSEAPSFLKQLQEIEVAAKEEMAAWDPKYSPQTADPVPGASQVPAKRKGK